MSKTLFVSTCGISLLSNGATTTERELLTRTANFLADEFIGPEKLVVDNRMRLQADTLMISSLIEARRLSAELNGILGSYGGVFPPRSSDLHILLHTDTYQGEVVATALAEWLRSKNLNANVQLVHELTTRTVSDFRAGISSLIQWCEESLPGYREQKYRIVFNLSGGFKSLQGFMQTLGMFYADELVYIFENNTEILRIPRIPIEISASIHQTLRKHLRVFRQLGRPGSTLSKDPLRDIPETLLFELDGEVELSTWGRLAWERSKSELYREQILDPLSANLTFSAEVRHQAASLQPDSIATFNERMDDLSHYLDSERKIAIQRLDFKQLKGNPCPPSTHECDLWANRGAWRAFGHFEGQKYLVDKIGLGLH